MPGCTYGKGVGKMPTLVDVLNTFPDKKFMIDHKDRSRETATLVINTLKKYPPDQQDNIYYYGNDEMFNYIRSEIPGISWLFCNRYWAKQWFKRYYLTLGLFGFPEESSGYVLAIRPQHTKFMMKWPYRFIKDLHKSSVKFYMYIDSAEDAQKYQDFPIDGIVTDYIEVVGEYFGDR